MPDPSPTGKRYYQLIIDKYFGDVLVSRIKKVNPKELRDIFKYGKEPEMAKAEWIDLSGLLCSKKRIELLISNVTNGKIDSFEKDKMNFFAILIFD